MEKSNLLSSIEMQSTVILQRLWLIVWLIKRQLTFSKGEGAGEYVKERRRASRARRL